MAKKPISDPPKFTNSGVDKANPDTVAASIASGRTVPPIHPLFFALFLPLSLYASNVGEVPWTDVVRPVCLSVGAMLFLYLLFGLVLRNVRRAAVVVSVFLFLFFSYGHFLTLAPAVTDVLAFFSSNASSIDSNMYLLPFWGLILVAVVYLCLRSKRDFRPGTAILNVTGFVLVLIPVCLIATSGSRYPGFAPVLRTLDLASSDDSDETPMGRGQFAYRNIKRPTSTEPDIYYIILDAYGRRDVLQRYYSFDNQPFLDALQRRGFFVAKRARPNYGQTIASIASSLNMTYLDKLVERIGVRATNLSMLTSMVDKNAAAAFLREHGYKFVAISTGFGLTATPSADVFLGGKSATTSNVNPYEGLLLDLTPLLLLPRTNQTLYDQHRESILAGFASLGNAAHLPFRKFVFAHILVPHPPFVFRANGEPVDQHGLPYSLADGSDWMHRRGRPEYRAHYIDQLRFANTQTLKAIDTILATSRIRPVILIQGDHGPRQFLDWRSLKNTDVKETYGNLSAFELPDGAAGNVFYDSASPVNSFRLLFNHIFAARFPQLPDRSFYSTLDLPFNYTDVTNDSMPSEDKIP